MGVAQGGGAGPARLRHLAPQQARVSDALCPLAAPDAQQRPASRGTVLALFRRAGADGAAISGVLLEAASDGGRRSQLADLSLRHSRALAPAVHRGARALVGSADAEFGSAAHDHRYAAGLRLIPGRAR